MLFYIFFRFDIFYFNIFKIQWIGIQIIRLQNLRIGLILIYGTLIGKNVKAC